MQESRSGDSEGIFTATGTLRRERGCESRAEKRGTASKERREVTNEREQVGHQWCIMGTSRVHHRNIMPYPRKEQEEKESKEMRKEKM